jgi:transposase
MQIMRTDSNDQARLPKRRYYKPEFKASVVKQTQAPTASVAGVALQHGINPVTVHRWIREARQFQSSELAAFIPLNLAPHNDLAAVAKNERQTIRIDLGPQGSGVSLNWPVSASHELTVWLREWLR